MGKIAGAVLKVLDVECAYGANKVLDGITFAIEKGSFTGIIGPNGSGKSTLLRCISRVLKPVRGVVLLDDRNVYGLGSRDVAKLMAVVPQETVVNFPFTVEEVVVMGRSPHLGRFQSEGKRDFEIAARVMDLTNIRHLAGRPVTAISGGERQRVIIAKALAQEPEVILLDEPTSHLDINQQLEILNLLQRLNRETKLTIISVFHDLNLAAQYCDTLILMQEGRIFALGTPEEVLTVQNIKAVYSTNVLVNKHSITGRPVVMLLAPGRQKGIAQAKIHVLCGGGTGTALLSLLANHGYELTAGVLNIGDIDWEVARLLGLKIAEEAPFCPVSERSHEENFGLIKRADACIMASIPFGHGNLKNLQAAIRALEWGKPVLLIEEQRIEQRDFTGGRALHLYNELKQKGAVVLRDGIEVLDVLPKLLPRKDTSDFPKTSLKKI
ncbi:MAG: heme ABC transporter ATP-binding protein [Peptococcaceae bacterium]|nr:heme ABC transporter ATP-binding protein [Peptococcaceae bacterium]